MVGKLSAVLSCLSAAVYVKAQACLPADWVTNATIQTDTVGWYYPNTTTGTPLLVGNDGSALGGLLVYTLTPDTDILNATLHTTGRSKLVDTVYDVAGRDWIVSISQVDSTLRAFDVATQVEQPEAQIKLWGDFNALCGWKAVGGSGAQYLYVFGKKQLKILEMRDVNGTLITSEVQTAKVPIEAETCVLSNANSTSQILFGGEDGNIYGFPALESTTAPNVTVVKSFNNTEKMTSFATYVTPDTEYLFVAGEEMIEVYSENFTSVGSLQLEYEDYKLSGISLFQSNIISDFPEGAIALALELDSVPGFVVSSLKDILAEDLKITNSSFTPPRSEVKASTCGFGYAVEGDDKCSCFAGYTGANCTTFTCADCSGGNGQCTGPNVCTCTPSFTGPTCAFSVVHAKYETQENGEDGDDPAIWISADDVSQSRIITTTKSEVDAGLSVFDLTGVRLQSFAAGEPNNVDVIYGFPIEEGKQVDLAVAACRKDNTLCLFDISSNGTLSAINGGSHPTPANYEVYGSCVYRSPHTDKFYAFVNSKTAEYLQYELTATNGAIEATLVRNFTGGNGGQVEGCVVDDENAALFVGEEPYGLWRFGAEPDAGDEKVLVDSVDGKLFADIEGVTLINGPDASSGFILVSCQGLSVYAVYKRAAPHDFVKYFSVLATADGAIDGTTNTDGLAAVSTRLNDDFPMGLVVLHDDVNELQNGTASAEAAFKLVSLEDVFGQDKALSAEIGVEWNPRT
ncbi:hypothetical protein DL96DRAFT_1499536 [Flagelloscypha sp. PMI_526]|nr:hypothetical protein DL96DRAFT_1499536 [Flagelloscypha sp. PMI_526]